MRKVRWEITNNVKVGKDFKEYDKVTYECKDDDIWVTTEIPLSEVYRQDTKIILTSFTMPYHIFRRVLKD